jgi:hypothetical protein
MNAETQIEQAVTAPKSRLQPMQANQSNQNAVERVRALVESPNRAKRLLKDFSRDAIAEAVAGVDCGAVIVGLLKSK